MEHQSTVEPDLVDSLIRYVEGQLDDAETLVLFANLTNSGVAWALGGSYARVATNYIEAGLLTWESSGALGSPVFTINWDLFRAGN